RSRASAARGGGALLISRTIPALAPMCDWFLSAFMLRSSPTDIVNPDILLGPQRPDLLRDEVLADLFEATAARRPGHCALVFEDRSLNYRELDAMANLAASRLIDAGVRPGQIVGLWLPRGIDLIVMQLA